MARDLSVRGAIIVAAALVAWPAQSRAAIPGITGPTFTLTANAARISTPEGNAVYFWGYANGAGDVQYPGPTLIVNEGDLVTVNLTNQLAVDTSIVFPGQTGVTVAGGVTSWTPRRWNPANTPRTTASRSRSTCPRPRT